MQNLVRTTIRIRKDLLDQSRLLALKKGSTVQDVINDVLAKGYKQISDLQTTEEAMKQIDAFRRSMASHHINLEKLLQASKQDQK